MLNLFIKAGVGVGLKNEVVLKMFSVWAKTEIDAIFEKCHKHTISEMLPRQVESTSLLDDYKVVTDKMLFEESKNQIWMEL